MDHQAVAYCPYCGRPLTGSQTVEPAPLYDELAQTLAALRSVRLGQIVVLTSILLGAAAGVVVRYHTIGSLVASAICVVLAVALWYGRFRRYP